MKCYRRERVNFQWKIYCFHAQINPIRRVQKNYKGWEFYWLYFFACAFFEVFFHILNSFLSLLSWYFFIIQKYTQSNIPSLKQQLELYSNNLHVWTFFARNEKLFKNFMFKKINAGTNSFTDLHSLSLYFLVFLSVIFLI